METAKKSYKQALLCNAPAVASDPETLKTNTRKTSPMAHKAGDLNNAQKAPLNNAQKARTPCGLDPNPDHVLPTDPMAHKAGDLNNAQKAPTPHGLDPNPGHVLPTDPMAHKAGDLNNAQKATPPPCVDRNPDHGLPIGLRKYLTKLSHVRTDIQIFTNNCLLLRVCGEPIEIEKLSADLKLEWKLADDSVEFLNRANQWVEIRFTNQDDKERVWGSRPYHVSGQLLVLRPWKPNFDPLRNPIKSLDLWIRILSLPTEFMRKETVEAILDFNGVGSFIKLDQYTRVCVNVDITKRLRSYVIVPSFIDDQIELKSYRIWYEDFSDGCGSCGEEDHTLEGCPLNTPTCQITKVVIDKRSPMVKAYKVTLNKGNNLTSGCLKIADSRGDQASATDGVDKGEELLPNDAPKELDGAGKRKNMGGEGDTAAAASSGLKRVRVTTE